MDDSSQCEDTKQQDMEENAVYEVRATRSAYTSKTRSKEVSSHMMAKPQSVVKLRRFGSLLNGVV